MLGISMVYGIEYTHLIFSEKKCLPAGFIYYRDREEAIRETRQAWKLAAKSYGNGNKEITTPTHSILHKIPENAVELHILLVTKLSGKYSDIRKWAVVNSYRPRWYDTEFLDDTLVHI